MNRTKGVITVSVLLLLLAADLSAQELKPAEPTKEHEWLKQLAGEWEGDVANCTQNARLLGGLWLVSDFKATVGDKPMSAVLTIGYDPQTKKFVGTWIDSMTTHLWTYEGTLDATGKILTLAAEGPNPATGKIAKMRDVLEIKTKDHNVMSSQIQGDDGKWQTFMTVNYKRKK